MDWEAERFYKKKIQNKLPFPPTAVLDSGRGLYVIYAFRHCSYHMESLYRAIMKAFYIRFKELCIDDRCDAHHAGDTTTRYDQ